MAARNPDWLNAEFIQKVLKKSECDDTIEVTDLTTKAATAKGDNYTSDMIRATIEYSCKKSGRKVSQKKSLIIKISPELNGAHKDMILKVGLFDTEIRMMDSTLESMNSILNEEGYRLGARALYTKTGDPSVLVVEDLAPLGFRMADREAGLDLQHCILAMRGLAKFHASSVALYEKDPKQLSTYNRGIFNNNHPGELTKFFKDGMASLSKEVANWQELGPSYSEKLSKLVDICYHRAATCTEPNDDEFNVLNHGDFWVNNMLFRYDNEGKVTDHIFVDFQLCVWTSPAIDILYFFNTSPSDEVEANHRDALLEEYLTTLTKMMSKLRCKTKPPTMAALEKSMKEREFYGVISACSILPLILVEKSEAKSLDEILVEDGSYENPGYKAALYRKTMLRRLPMWNARGILDV